MADCMAKDEQRASCAEYYNRAKQSDRAWQIRVSFHPSQRRKAIRRTSPFFESQEAALAAALFRLHVEQDGKGPDPHEYTAEACEEATRFAATLDISDNHRSVSAPKGATDTAESWNEGEAQQIAVECSRYA